jgi:soluble lytic murein transglycosylase
MRLLQILVVSVASLMGGASSYSPADPQLALQPTAHPPLPGEEQIWLVPSEAERRAAAAVSAGLAAAVQRYRAGDHAAALTALTRVGPQHPLADYGQYYKGLAHLRLKQLSQARAALEAVEARRPDGALAAAVVLAQGAVAEADGDHRRAVRIYQRLAGEKHLVNEDVLSRLGRAALAASDRKTAAEAYVRVYYEYPLTTAATTAGSRLTGLQDQIVRTGYSADLGRAAMLFGARRYADARAAYQELRSRVSGGDRALADLRIAQCDYHLKRYPAAREGLRPHLGSGPHQAEARFYYLSALRELGQHAEYVSRTRALVKDFPDSSWAEEALNNLGTHYILTGQDETAARVFGEQYKQFPAGAQAQRAAWKFGWWSYRNRDFRTAVRVFESAAATFPRSDYRPSYLYWAARAHAHLGVRSQAEARYRLVYTDYGNSYYGRLVQKQFGSVSDQQTAAIAVSYEPPAVDAPHVPNGDRIRLLLAHGLYDDALDELRYAQRRWGTNAVVEATIAWAFHQKGELRRAITLMRRAYPQHLTASGQDLPVEIRQVIFPLVYWDLIRKYSAERKLDPYLVAALVAQESTFEPSARSVANAIGLMQILPATGRRLAQSAGMKSFSPAMLTRPDMNIRLGTLYFSRLVERFGGTHFALASYNAGENRVVRWRSERPGIDDDEFIDDIPFPETQNYVKRILGTAEDYRLLYARDGGRPLSGAGLSR